VELIFIEGLPGSGKTTMARVLCEFAQHQGRAASWYLEEMSDHPVHPHSFRRQKSDSGFPERCLARWDAFVSGHEDGNHLHIFDGSLFQSTVRHMLEAGHPRLIPGYYRDCQRILARVCTRLIYLRPDNYDCHINWTMTHRGEHWSNRVSAYLEQTAFCVSAGVRGRDCMRYFWPHYVRLCDGLVQASSIPHHTVRAGAGCFERQVYQAAQACGLAMPEGAIN